MQLIWFLPFPMTAEMTPADVRPDVLDVPRPQSRAEDESGNGVGESCYS